MQSENPIVQSVSNFSNFRKENTKPYSGVSKTICPPLTNYSCSSTDEEISRFKEEKSLTSQSLRKDPPSPAQFDSKGVVFTPLKFEVAETEQNLYDKLSKNTESKPFLERNNGEVTGAGTVIAQLQASMLSEAMSYEEGSDNLAFEQAASVDLVKDEEFETNETENHANVDHHPFSYAHETSDIDSFADSPVASPSSWSVHSLNQTDSTARTRKQWGNAQGPPFIVANSSNTQSHKDVVSGFKRLLNFGRKSRGTESLVDWVSVEEDDDMEDERVPANRSSQDPIKLRMGSSQGHPSEDSFGACEFFSKEGELYVSVFDIASLGKYGSFEQFIFYMLAIFCSPFWFL